MAWVALGTEDELSEAVGLRLLAEQHDVLQLAQCLRKSGFGYLKKRMPEWRQLAQHQTVVLITDLDRLDCPIRLLDDWCGKQVLPANLILRIAVREVEAWLLADHEGMESLLGRRGRLPADPDGLPDPKDALLQLARRAPKDVRDDLVASAGTVARQGLGYNARLTGFVRSNWSPERAAQRSTSLARARRRLALLAETYRQSGI